MTISFEKIYIIEIFNSEKNAIEEDIVNKLEMVWNYTEHNMECGIWFVALMFYLRNIRQSKYMIEPGICVEININEPKSFKNVSYYMALWLLKHHPGMFIANHTRFVSDIGYYKDCLNMSKMAKDRGYSKEQIDMILMPMAIALINDKYTIIQSYVNPNDNQKKISLASKWAPRQGKAFAEFIPQLKKLCNITEPQSNMKWRKYIQQIIKSSKINMIPIETYLSNKNYEQINMANIPIKAFKLYKNKFLRTPELRNKYVSKSSEIYSFHNNQTKIKFLGNQFKLQNLYYDEFNFIEEQLTLIHETLGQFIPLVTIKKF
jgi:hypothetical protein